MADVLNISGMAWTAYRRQASLKNTGMWNDEMNSMSVSCSAFGIISCDVDCIQASMQGMRRWI